MLFRQLLNRSVFCQVNLGRALLTTTNDLSQANKQKMALSQEGFLRIGNLLKGLVRCGGHYSQIHEQPSNFWTRDEAQLYLMIMNQCYLNSSIKNKPTEEPAPDNSNHLKTVCPKIVYLKYQVLSLLTTIENKFNLRRFLLNCTILSFLVFYFLTSRYS